jgi:hypothetical protein
MSFLLALQSELLYIRKHLLITSIVGSCFVELFLCSPSYGFRLFPYIVNFLSNMFAEKATDAPIRKSDIPIIHFALWTMEKLAIGWLRREYSEAVCVLNPRRLQELP